MKGILLGRRKSLLQRHRLLLFEDRIEEVTDALLGLEVRRLFFDETESVTVHRTYASLIITGLLLLLFGLVLVLVAVTAGDRELLFGLAILVLMALLALVFQLVCPPHLLKVRAPGQVLEAHLPVLPPLRERALRRLVEAIERYQREHAAGGDDSQ
jgi:hypothetical protein